MSDNKGSFWSTIPGVVTGLAGVLTAIVGLITVLIQLGVLGGDDNSGQRVTTDGTTVPSGATQATTGGGAPTTTEPGRLTVNPTALALQGTERSKALTVKNASTVTVNVRSPEITGADKSVFQADAGCTNVKLAPGDTCTLKVLFAPSGPLRSYTASVVVKGDHGTPDVPVPIQASSIL